MSPRLLFGLVLLLAPVTRFPGFFHLVTPVKVGLAALAMGAWLWARGPFRQAGAGVDAPRVASDLPPTWPPPVRHLSWLFLGLVLWTGLTALLSTTTAGQGMGLLLAHVTVCAFFYPSYDFASSDGITGQHMLWVFIASAGGVAALAMLQYVVVQFGVLPFLVDLIIPKIDRDLIAQAGAEALPAWGYRSWGTFHHPNLLGAFLGLAFPVAAALVMATKNRLGRGLFLLATLMIGGGIFCSGSRGGWLNAAVGMACLLLLQVRRIPKAWWLTAATALPVVGWVLRDDIRRYFRLDSILSNRDIIWGHSWTLISERPLFGWGPGTFSRTYLERFDFPSYIERGTAMRELASFGEIHLLDHWHAHNLWLHYGAEMGLLGGLWVLLIFLVYLREVAGSRLWRRRLDRRGWLAAGCSAAVVGNLAHSMLETTINVAYPAIGIPFISVLAGGLVWMRRRDAAP